MTHYIYKGRISSTGGCCGKPINRSTNAVPSMIRLGNKVETYEPDTIYDFTDDEAKIIERYVQQKQFDFKRIDNEQ